MAQRYQVRIFNTNFTTLEATVSDHLLYVCSAKQEINAAYDLTFTVSRSDASFSSIARGKTVELRQLDLTTSNPTGVMWHYRVARISDLYFNGDPAVEVFCEGLHYDLALKTYFDSGSFIEQTPTTIMTALLADHGWTVGTVTPTAKVTLEYHYQSVLELLQRLAELTGYELDYTTTPSGTPTRQVHLRIIGNQSSTSSIVIAKNLLELKRDAEISKANIVYGLGGIGSKSREMSLANATHRITAISSNTLTLDSTKILGSNNGYTSMSIVKPDGSLTAIASAEKSTLDKITVASASGLVVGDKIRFVFTASGAPVEFVLNSDRITAESSHSVVYRNEKLTDVENLIGPAAVSAFNGPYTLGLCDGWSQNGLGTATENSDTSYIINGTRSQKFVVSSYTATPSVLAVAANSYETEIDGTVTYKAALLGPDGEGPLGSASSGVAISFKGITVTVDPGLTSAHVIGARVYRSLNGGSYKHVRDIIEGDSYVFVDTMSEAALGATPPADTNKLAGGQGIYVEFDTVVGKEYAAVFYFFVTSGKVRVVLDVGEQVPDDTVQPENKSFSASTYAKVCSLQGVIATQTTGRLYIMSHEGPATFYADSAMVVQNPYPPDHTVFVADNSATTLWYEAYDELQRIENEADLKQYSVSFSDLYEAGIGTDVINLGDKITVTDTNIGVNEQVRVTAKRFNAKESWKDLTLELASQYRRTRDEYYERKKQEQAIMAAQRKQVTYLSEMLAAFVGSERRTFITSREIRNTD